jgi:hypothetical protein
VSRGMAAQPLNSTLAKMGALDDARKAGMIA